MKAQIALPSERQLMPHQLEGVEYCSEFEHPALLMAMRKPIPGFPGCYVYRFGAVVGARGKRLKISADGRVTLCYNNKQCRLRVSVLVLTLFVRPRPKGKLALHKDDNVLNNRVSNLYWGTHSQNVRDSIRNGHHVGNSQKRSDATRIKNCLAHISFSPAQVKTIVKTNKIGGNLSELAREWGVPVNRVYGVIYRNSYAFIEAAEGKNITLPPVRGR